MADQTAAPQSPARLARHLGLGALVMYGVGDMLGSGIYALTGKVAGTMGSAIWLAFLAAMVAALLTALSYASLGSRYPRAAGAAYCVHRAFGRPFISYLIGLAVLASGLTSMATQSRVFSEYFSALVPGLPAAALILAFIAGLTFINFWGIREASWFNMLCTLIEVAGLVIIIAVGYHYLGSVSYLETPVVNNVPTPLSLSLVLQGAVLTFYSFIGFEDMINVVEEVKEPRKTFPRALLLAMGIVTVLYIAVSLTAVSVVPHADLFNSKEPLVEVVRRAAPGFPTPLFSAIALFAISNTALLNYIMGSRLMYGMARQGLLPHFLSAVHPRRHTPHLAILVLMGLVVVLALTLNVQPLAKATSVLLMSVFVVLNFALLVLQRRPGEPRGTLEVPAAVPVGGIIISLALIAHAKPTELTLAGALVLGIVLLYVFLRPRNVTEDTFAQAAEEATHELGDD
jgi:amino acid transporter